MSPGDLTPITAARQVPPVVSVIVPLRDEESTLRGTAAAVGEVLDRHALPYELIFVDDGSTDSSAAVLSVLVGSDPRVKAIRLRRNFGKAAALATGFSAASGKWVVTIDADLQDDPEEIPVLLAKLREGHHLVSGWKKHRRDSLSRRLASRLFNSATRKISGLELHDINCGLKAYTRECAEELVGSCYGEQHRYLPVVARWKGFSVAEVAVNHRKRISGRSRYGLGRYLKGLLDLVTTVFLSRYARRPMHVFGSMGLVLLSIGSGTLLALAVLKLVLGAAMDPRALAIVGAVSFIAGLQLVLTGLVAEMLSRLPALTAKLAEAGPAFPAVPITERGSSEAPSPAVLTPLQGQMLDAGEQPLAVARIERQDDLAGATRF
jgi:glycosyltransferase involved in cell wall biosynthesis